MNTSFVAISTPVKSNLGERCLINALMNISSQSLRAYLRLANVYDGNSNKKKADLVEMIVYTCMINEISKEPIKDIPMNRDLNTLKEHSIYIKPLPGYGDFGLRKKDIKPYTNECSIKRKE